jgi:ABC-type phosphate/phosphonate transport system substrate-binding protein
MPAKLVESVQSIMVGLANSEEGRSILKSAATTGIGKAGDKDYDSARKMTIAVFGKSGMSK